MAKYVYEGDEELVFPTLSKIVRKGDTFEGPEGLNYSGLTVVDGKKAKLIETTTAETTDPASAETLNNEEK